MKQRNFKFAALFFTLLLACGTASAQAPAEAEQAADESAASQEAARPECVRVTGSRICRDPGSVNLNERIPNTASNITVYSRDDLEKTGQPTTGESLRLLDPRLRNL